jgi:AcrR family transcriptional regulator
MNATKPLRVDAQRNREAILAAARKVFEAGDYDLRFDDFAKLAGVGTGTLYRHFPSREVLVAEVYQEEVANLCERARELQATLPAADALALFLREMVDYMEPRQGLARTLAALMAPRSDEFSEGSRALEQAVTELVAAGIAEGAIRDDVDAGAVMMALHGIGAAHDRPNWRPEADGVATLLIDGLRRPRSSDRSLSAR